MSLDAVLRSKVKANRKRGACGFASSISCACCRRRQAEIVGTEINLRSRAIAKRRVASDACTKVIAPGALAGSFDVIFAPVLLQLEPHRTAEMAVEDHSLFDRTVQELVGWLRSGGLPCVDNADYRNKDSSPAVELQPIADSPNMAGLLFGSDGQRLRDPAKTIFRKI